MSDQNTSSISNYYQAFSAFLKNGDVDDLTEFVSAESREISRSYLQIYRNGFLKTSIEAIRNNFPVTSSVLTEEPFLAMARLYVNNHPPKIGTLTGYGEHVHEILDKQFDNKAASDIAKLDYAWLSSLNSAYSPPLSAERIQQLDQEGVEVADLNVQLSKSSLLTYLEYDVFELWQDLKLNQSTDADLKTKTVTTSLNSTLSTILFWQFEGEVIARSLDDDERVLLESIQSGKTLGEATEMTFELYPSADIPTIFSNLLSYHILTEV